MQEILLCSTKLYQLLCLSNNLNPIIVKVVIEYFYYVLEWRCDKGLKIHLYAGTAGILSSSNLVHLHFIFHISFWL